MATTIAVNSTLGTTIGISSSLPATYDATGYNAVTFTTVGEVLEIGAIGKNYEIIKHYAVSRNHPQNIKDGRYDLSAFTLKIATSTGDTGQDLLRTAADSNNSYSYKITLPYSSATIQFTGKISKWSHEAKTANSSSVDTYTVEVTPDAESLLLTNF